METTRDLLTIRDAEGRIQYVSPSLERLLGFDPSEMVGVLPLDEVHPEDRPAVEQVLAALRSEPDRPQRLEYRVRHKDGGWRVFDTHAVNLLDDPDVRGIVVNSRDVTAEREAQREARRSQAYIDIARLVAVAANEAADLEAAMRIVIPEIAGWLDWPVGHAYRMEDDRLVPTGTWHLSDPDRYRGFRERSDALRLRPSEGLIGSAYQAGTPLVWEDVMKEPAFVRRGSDPELRTGLAVPVLAGRQTVAVLEFYTPEPWSADPHILDLAHDLGTQLGRVAEREIGMRALEENHSLLNALVEAIPDPIFVKDRAGRYLLANSPCAAQLGRPREEVLGRTDRELLPAIRAAAIEAIDHEVLETGRRRTFEETLTGSDGETRNYLTSKGVISDGAGRVLGLYGIARDITDRKRAEDALRERVKELRTLYGATAALSRNGVPMEERLAAVVELVPPGWQYPDVTEARIVLHGREYRSPGFIATPWSMVSPIRLDGRQVGLIEVVYTARRPAAAEGPFIREERQLLDALATTIAERLERRRLEEQFNHSQRMEAVGRLAGGIAHDFNNLLTAITGNTELLLSSVHSAAVHEELEEILTAARRAGELTAQLLAFSRRDRVEPQVMDLGAMVRDYEPMLRRLISEVVRIETEHAPDPIPVRADPTQIGQVLLNMAVNSQDAMPDGGRLTIRTQRVRIEEGRHLATGMLEPGRYALLEVEDTGRGMDEETRRHVFDPFFTTKPAGKGTGLGLSLVYGVVQRAGGQIGVRSCRDEGTRFRIFIPLSPDPLDRTEPDPTSAARGGSERILVVEDEQAVRRLIERVLVGRGYEVVSVEDGAEALRLLRDGRSFDAVVSDLVMPRLGGLQLVNRMRELGLELPVVLMTGYTEDEVPRLDGAAEFLIQKPFHLDDLLRQVRGALDAARSS